MASIQVLEISPAETPIEDLSYDVAGNLTGGLYGQLFGEAVAEVIRAVFIQCRITYPDNPDQAVDCTKDVLAALFLGI